MTSTVEDWRVVEDFPKYEIDKLGVIRMRKTRRIINTTDGHRERLRIRKDGFRLSIPVRSLRNQAFPEMKPL